mmetsp:Transcript_16833/g.36346  ORF Transcript_16833/g.36346 Transcript_16833/m.36346 type:complete len:195 (-) Transcript_16833:1617-2201(-)
MTPIIPLACLAFVNARASLSNRKMSQCLAAASQDAIASLPSLNTSDGSAMKPDELADTLKGKRVALYFAAGWCPMCTSFEPSLLQFREAAVSSGKDVEIIYVPSDRSDADVVKRTKAMGMMSVPIGEEADELKKRYKIWAGAECMKLGMGRRSGVPALVVLDPKNGDEMAFLPAESQGVKALGSWQLDNGDGVW